MTNERLSKLQTDRFATLAMASEGARCRIECWLFRPALTVEQLDHVDSLIGDCYMRVADADADRLELTEAGFAYLGL